MRTELWQNTDVSIAGDDILNDFFNTSALKEIGSKYGKSGMVYEYCIRNSFV